MLFGQFLEFLREQSILRALVCRQLLHVQVAIVFSTGSFCMMAPWRRHGLKTRRGARKKSVSPLRAFLSLRNAFGMRTDAEKDVTTIEIGRDVLEAN